MPPYPQAVSSDGDRDGHSEEDPQVGRCDGVAWSGIESEGVVHAEERLARLSAERDQSQSVSLQKCTHGYESAGEESQSQHSYRLHRGAVLPCLFRHLRGGFGKLNVQQVVASTFFGDPARTLRNLNVESVVSLDDEICDLQRCQY
jgi:hypothetical protein